ncbi:MAG: hypothetical protein AUH32_06095 [Actinobacteria bacterium 13_1_40CM_66_12]|nr:MAG: hypothetical protein AUH32_06095 [Actinobacteria bacterium 13_1_40CM_66_12]
MSVKSLGRLARIALEPNRIPRELLLRWPGASFEARLKWDAMDRPDYAYGTYQAARQARALGLGGITVIEMGVAGGRGLLALERHARAVQEQIGIEIAVFGFDLGSGLPQPRDYRDMPYVWRSGYFAMDGEQLRDRLQTAEIVVGDVAETVPQFLTRRELLPIGFVAFDLDYYSSTAAALALLSADAPSLLPRVFCHFDDVVGDDWELHSEYTGELLAISEFSAGHSDRKVAPIHGLAYKRAISAEWHAKQYVLHYFSHPLYEKHIGRSDWQVPVG